MKKIFLALFGLFIWVNISAQEIAIEVNVNMKLEGTITSKKGGKLSNAVVSIYGWNKLWIITTNNKGDYQVDLSQLGTKSSAPEGLNGNEKIIFYYSDKRYKLISINSLDVNGNSQNGPPTVHLDVKL